MVLIDNTGFSKYFKRTDIKFFLYNFDIFMIVLNRPLPYELRQKNSSLFFIIFWENQLLELTACCWPISSLSELSEWSTSRFSTERSICFLFLLFFCFFLWSHTTRRLAWNFLCRPGSLGTRDNPPDSTSWIPVLQLLPATSVLLLISYLSLT